MPSAQQILLPPEWESDFPAGSLALANHPTRYWFHPERCGAATYRFAHKCEGTKQFNEALRLFAGIHAPERDLYFAAQGIYEDAHWMFRVFSREKWAQQNETLPGADCPNPSIIVRYDAPITWRKVVVPEGITILGDGPLGPPNPMEWDVTTYLYDAVNGRPIRSATLTARDGMRDTIGIVDSSPEGVAKITGLSKWPESLLVHAEGYATRTVWKVAEPRPGKLEAHVFLAPAVTLRGRTVDPTGAPIPHAVVDLLSEWVWGPDGAPYTGTTSRILHSDADGWFQFDDLPLGSVQLQARAPGYYGAVPFSLPVPDDAFILILQPAGRIEGRVENYDPDSSCCRLEMQCDPIGMGPKIYAPYHEDDITRVQDDSTFVFEDIPAGNHTVYACPPASFRYDPNLPQGMTRYRQHIIVHSNQTTSIIYDWSKTQER